MSAIGPEVVSSRPGVGTSPAWPVKIFENAPDEDGLDKQYYTLQPSVCARHEGILTVEANG